ncbi:MAG TPA: tetratricopeptide repeat protein [Nitrospirota bacterium]|nr:tetratricopeptide repeat protein [Nitrospirota bacterium]
MADFKRTIAVCSLLFFTACASHKGPAPVVVSVPPPSAPVIAGPQEGFSLAMDAYKVNDMATTILIAQQVMEQYPNNPWQKRSLFLTGRALIALDRTAEAETVLLRVPAEYPELADYALFFLAEHLSSKTRYEDAIKLYQQLIDHFAKSSWVIRATLRKAQVLFDAGFFPRAAEAYEKFLTDYPRSDLCPEAGLGLGKALAADTRITQAVKAYQEVNINYPGSPADQEAQKALDELKLCGADIPELTPDDMYERARNLFKANQNDKAYDAFMTVLDREPAHSQKVDILLRAGISLFRLGKRSEAASMLEHTMKEHPPERHGAEALKWLGKVYSRLGRKEEAIGSYLKIIAAYPDSAWADDALFLIGNIYRESNDMKKALKFYDRLADEYPESKFADSAIWWKAWAYYTSGDFKNTEQTLQELILRYPRSFLVPQALYWQGRAAEKRANKSRAVGYYRRVLVRGPYTYYGHRSSEKLLNMDVSTLAVAEELSVDTDGKAGEPFTLDVQESTDADGPPVWTEEAVRALSAEPSFKKTLELMHLNMKTEAAAELWALQEKIPRKRGGLLGLSKAFFELGDYYRSLILVLRNYERYLEGAARETSEDFWLLAYPQGYWESILSYSRKYGQDPYFVAAIIREESQFHSEALSPAGARGVMQVMPSTGEWVAQSIRLRGFDRNKLFDSDTGINIGTWYISHLMKRFKEDPLFVSAAYNAGPEAVLSWLGKNGHFMDRDEFIESIPFSETRGYVKKVLRNYAEYKRIYGKAGQNATLTPLYSGSALAPLFLQEEVKGQ